MSNYADCIYCGGLVTEQYLQREIHWKKRLYVVENIPTGVCRQCGEKFLKPRVAKAVDELLAHGKPVKKVEVPVFSFVISTM